MPLVSFLTLFDPCSISVGRAKITLSEKHIETCLSFSHDMISFPYVPEIVFTDDAIVWLHDNNHNQRGGFTSILRTNFQLISMVQIFGAVNMLLDKVYFRL